MDSEIRIEAHHAGSIPSGRAGKVIKARVVCGETSSRFIVLSLAAARASTFPATELNGQPVQIAGFVTYSFAIR